jgi:hypothetical protein
MVLKIYIITYGVILIIIINEVKNMSKISSVREKRFKKWVVTIMLSFIFWIFHFVTIFFFKKNTISSNLEE